MNKVILMGRLTRDPEVRYSQGAEPTAIARYSLAVNRRFKREGEPDADFINCVAFGKSGEFAEKFFKKGQQVSVVGHLQVSSYTDKDGTRKWSTDVVIEEQHFAESRRSFEDRMGQEGSDMGYSQAPAPSKSPSAKPSEGFVPIDSFDDDDLPF
jgi:single-strand DNA-binding protein